MNGIFSKFKNRNIKFGNFKQLDGKNTENCSSSKNISIKPPNHQKIISTKTSVSFVHNQVKKYIYNIKNKMNNNFNNHFNTLNSHIKSLKDNNIKNKDISFKKSKNKISQLKISSNNKSKTLLLDKKGSKAPFSNVWDRYPVSPVGRRHHEGPIARVRPQNCLWSSRVSTCAPAVPVCRRSQN